MPTRCAKCKHEHCGKKEYGYCCYGNKYGYYCCGDECYGDEYGDYKFCCECGAFGWPEAVPKAETQQDPPVTDPPADGGSPHPAPEPSRPEPSPPPLQEVSSPVVQRPKSASSQQSARSLGPEALALVMGQGADIRRLLERLDFTHYADRLISAGCDSMLVLGSLGEQPLVDLGVKPMHAKLILKEATKESPSTSAKGQSTSAAPFADTPQDSKTIQRNTAVSGEDGDIRPPISPLFKECKEVLPLSQALAPVHHLIPDYDITLALIARKARQKLRKFSETYGHMDENLVSYILMYTYESQPKTQSVYYLLNEALREPRREPVVPWVDYVWGLLCALKQLPVAQCTTVFRGCKKAFTDFGPNYAKGEEIMWYGFSSTADSIEVQKEFLGPTGDRTLFHLEMQHKIARDIRDLSWFPNESELLLPPGTLFEVHSIFDAGNGLTMVQMKSMGVDDEIVKLS